MSQITEQLQQAVEKQPSIASKLALLEAVLNNYDPEQPLGEAAIKICNEIAKESLETLDNISDLKVALDFIVLLDRTDPNRNELEEAGEDGEENEPWEPNFVYGNEAKVEKLVAFCLEGVNLYEALELTGLRRTSLTYTLQ